MTMQPQLAPQMPRLDPTNPYQMYDFWTQWLQLTDPSALAESDKEIGEWAAEEVEIALEDGMKAKGFHRGNPQERRDAYARKLNWATARDPQTGMLMHPVLETVTDPTTGQPVQVPSQTQGEDLWQEQQMKFPRQFEEDAKDAVKLGSPVPGWVLAYALAHGAGDAADAPVEPKPLLDTYAPPTQQGLVA